MPPLMARLKLIFLSDYLTMICLSIDVYYMYNRVFHENMFFREKNKRNPPRISLGVSLKESKRIFDFDQV